jgi:hypothetical protein
MDTQEKYKIAKSYFLQPDTTRSKFEMMNLDEPVQLSQFKRTNVGQKEM